MVYAGLANGYIQRDNIDPMVGLRFRFRERLVAPVIDHDGNF